MIKEKIRSAEEKRDKELMWKRVNDAFKSFPERCGGF